MDSVKKDKGITVLYPGGFKPPHGKHLQMAINHANLPGVKKVIVIVGPESRNGIGLEQSLKVWDMLLKGNPKIEVQKSLHSSPQVSAFMYVEQAKTNPAIKGDYMLAAGNRGDDLKKVYDFYNAFKPGGKYEVPGIVPHILSKSEIDQVTEPMYYEGRIDKEGKPDKKNGEEISATTLRQDLLNKDEKNFETNYPNVSDKGLIKQIYKMLVNDPNLTHIKTEPKPKKTQKKNISEILEEIAVGRLVLINLLKEGGNIFLHNGQIETTRIKKQDVGPTIEWLEKLTGLDLKNNLLGSTGKKEDSGDLDIALDQSKISKDELFDKLKSKGYKAKPLKKDLKTNPNLDLNAEFDIAKTGISVHFKTPIKGDPKNGYVQTDFMFGDPEYLKFSQSAPQNSDYKGVHKFMLLKNLARVLGYQFSQTEGLKVDTRKGPEETNKGEVVSKDPDKIAQILLGPGKKQEDLESVEKILSAIKSNSNLNNKFKEIAKLAVPDMKQYDVEKVERFKTDFPEEDVVKEVLKEILKKMILEDDKPKARIEHLEDLVYREKGGIKGAKKALELIKKLETPSREDFSLVGKWDGRPAVVFGKYPDGKFMFTDKPGFAFKDGSGRATSKEQLSAMYDGRTERRIKSKKEKGESPEPEVEKGYSKLKNSMVNVFETFEKAWPDELIGIFTGDMMYLDTPKEVKGQYVFRPNTVDYSISKNSSMGKKIGQSEVGVVLHSFDNLKGTKISQLKDISEYTFKGKKVFIFPPYMPKKSVKLDSSLYSQAQSAVQNGTSVDQFVNEKGAPIDMIYKFVNSIKGDFNSLTYDNFLNFLEGSKSAEFVKTHKEGTEQIFNIIKSIGRLKDHTIDKLNKEKTELSASINGKKGGEGFVITDKNLGQVKLVKRSGFTAANAEEHA